MAEPLVFLRGEMLPQAQAYVTLHDAGFVMGATVTDLCRTFQRRLYRWADHLERFRQSSRLADFVVRDTDVEITSHAETLVQHNAQLVERGQELAVVLFATPGPIGYYLGEVGGLGEAPVTFGMHTFPLPFARYRRLVENGAALIVPSVRQVPTASVDPRIKMRSRLHWWLADREAQRLKPGSMALLLSQGGHVTETAGANFLAVLGGEVVSSPPGEVLEGVSLRVVRELCAEAGIAFRERALTLGECLRADEAMLASTPYCLAGVASLNDVALTCPGPLTRRLIQAWSAKVGVDIWGQIKAPPGA